MATYAGRATDLTPWLVRADINDDLSMRLQYLAGMGLNFDRPVVMYNDMLGYRKFPGDLFSGSDANVSAVRFAIGERRR